MLMNTWNLGEGRLTSWHLLGTRELPQACGLMEGTRALAATT